MLDLSTSYAAQAHYYAGILDAIAHTVTFADLDKVELKEASTNTAPFPRKKQPTTRSTDVSRIADVLG